MTSNCMVYNWSYCPDGPLTEEDKLERGLGNGRCTSIR